MSDSLEQTFDDLTVHIDRERCIGSGNCVKLAEQVFELDDRSLVRFVAVPGRIDRDSLVEACAVCPVDALAVVTQEGQQIVP
ncbi:MAG: ferredoxin [Phycisphaeraceae bacterium]